MVGVHVITTLGKLLYMEHHHVDKWEVDGVISFINNPILLNHN
jgi:hypothetical protein